MLDLLMQYALFLAKALTAVAAIVATVALVSALLRQARPGSGDRLQIRHLNERLRDTTDALQAELLDDAEWKALEKTRKAKDRAEAKAAKRGETPPPKPRLFVLDFDGDIEASQVAALREEISALLQVAKPEDAVLVRLESGGGIVHAYGLAASQLKRIRDRGLRLTVAIDKVAASGGYMMACVADEIVAAPFAVVGSIGVVAQMPNFHRLLDKNAIDIELHTAGAFKRTLTMFGENTDAARQKFREELEDIHGLFKGFVAEHRPTLAIEDVATGEHWYGLKALTLGLIDRIRTSDDLILDAITEREVYSLEYRPRRNLREALLGQLARLARLRGSNGLAGARLQPLAGVDAERWLPPR